MEPKQSNITNYMQVLSQLLPRRQVLGPGREAPDDEATSARLQQLVGRPQLNEDERAALREEADRVARLTMLANYKDGFGALGKGELAGLNYYNQMTGNVPTAQQKELENRIAVNDMLRKQTVADTLQQMEMRKEINANHMAALKQLEQFVKGAVDLDKNDREWGKFNYDIIDGDRRYGLDREEFGSLDAYRKGQLSLSEKTLQNKQNDGPSVARERWDYDVRMRELARRIAAKDPTVTPEDKRQIYVWMQESKFPGSQLPVFDNDNQMGRTPLWVTPTAPIGEEGNSGEDDDEIPSGLLDYLK